MQVEIGATINKRYEIVYKVADGGMGELYYVRDLKLGGIARALKMIKPAYASGGWQQLLHQEAYLLTKLQHRNLPNIFDFEVVDGEAMRSILVMEWIEGIHLGQLLHQEHHRMSLSYVVYIAAEVLSALAYLHAQRPSIIHRDLKPSNIMLAKDGTIRLIDFGISKQLDQTSGHEEKFGTRGYCAPEQLHGLHTDERSDIYSFGAILLVMLGIDPLIYLTNKGKERELTRKLSYLPKSLSQLIIDCVQAHAQHRPQSISAIIQQLNEIAERYEWQDTKQSMKQLASLVQGYSPRQLGQKIAIFGAHAGAGATLVSLALSYGIRSCGIDHAYIAHTKTSGLNPFEEQVLQAIPQSTLQTAQQLAPKITQQTAQQLAPAPQTLQQTEQQRLYQTLKQTSLEAYQRHVLIDYSSHWQAAQVEDILVHADWIIIVSSPWIVSDPQHLSKLQQLLRLSTDQKLPVIWLSNRDQPFHDRGRWHKLSAGHIHIKLPELSSKKILGSLWRNGRIEPQSIAVKELSKYLMPLMKKVIRLQ